jgi:hypothetical protein
MKACLGLLWFPYQLQNIYISVTIPVVPTGLMQRAHQELEGRVSLPRLPTTWLTQSSEHRESHPQDLTGCRTCHGPGGGNPRAGVEFSSADRLTPEKVGENMVDAGEHPNALKNRLMDLSTATLNASQAPRQGSHQQEFQTTGHAATLPPTFPTGWCWRSST